MLRIFAIWRFQSADAGFVRVVLVRMDIATRELLPRYRSWRIRDRCTVTAPLCDRDIRTVAATMLNNYISSNEQAIALDDLAQFRRIAIPAVRRISFHSLIHHVDALYPCWCHDKNTK